MSILFFLSSGPPIIKSLTILVGPTTRVNRVKKLKISLNSELDDSIFASDKLYQSFSFLLFAIHYSIIVMSNFLNYSEFNTYLSYVYFNITLVTNSSYTYLVSQINHDVSYDGQMKFWHQMSYNKLILTELYKSRKPQAFSVHRGDEIVTCITELTFM